VRRKSLSVIPRLVIAFVYMNETGVYLAGALDHVKVFVYMNEFIFVYIT